MQKTGVETIPGACQIDRFGIWGLNLYRPVLASAIAPREPSLATVRVRLF